MLVNSCKIYVYINNKAVILFLMAICKKNQATISQKHTKDSSQLSNEDDDVLKFHGNKQSVSSIKSKSPG